MEEDRAARQDAVEKKLTVLIVDDHSMVREGVKMGSGSVLLMQARL
jgi:hypothetical protein